MSTMRFLAFTSIRADYDLVSDLYARIAADPSMELGLVVSGAHLSWSYGHTVEQIEADGLPIVARVESLLDSDSAAARLKSAAILMQGALEPVERFAPTAIFAIGDREDAVVAALTGAYLAVPVVHFFGGDHATDANVDNAARHAISKLASVHFVTHKTHAERLRAIGESSARIFVVGSPALDKFVATPQIDKKTLLASLERPGWEDYAVVVYHPLLGQDGDAGARFDAVLDAVRAEGLRAFVGYPTADAQSKRIISAIEQRMNDPDLRFYRSLERSSFVNLMRHATLMVGNSSAGILEAASIPLPVVNVGQRQRGRIAAENVVFVDDGVENVRAGIQQALETAFLEQAGGVSSPYGDGHSGEKICELLRALPFDELRFKHEDPLG